MVIRNLGLAAALALLAAAPAAHAALPAGKPIVIHRFDGKVLKFETIDAEARRLMAAGHVNGLAMAIIDRGEVVYVQTWGYANVAQNRTLNNQTIMYGASLTKFTFAYMVMQLVDEGKLDLDRPIKDYLPKPLYEYEDYASLKDDPRWEKLTARMLLTHSSGFMNFGFLEPDEQLHFHFDPGARYSYSGDGIILLQRVLEWGLHLDVEAEMKARVWDRFGMENTSLHWRPDFARDLADGYGIDGAFQAHDERERVRAAGSMDTTISDWADFLAGFMGGNGLKPRSHADMLRPQLPITTRAQFPTAAQAPGFADVVSPEMQRIGLSAGLGVVTFKSKYGPAFFKGGHDDVTANQAVCVERTRRCVIYFSNDVRAERIFQRLTEATVGDPGFPWSWENYVPYDQPAA